MKKLSGHPYLLFLEKTNCPFLLTKLTSPSWCFLGDDIAFAVVTLVPRTGAVRYIEVLDDWDSWVGCWASNGPTSLTLRGIILSDVPGVGIAEGLTVGGRYPEFPTGRTCENGTACRFAGVPKSCPIDQPRASCVLQMQTYLVSPAGIAISLFEAPAQLSECRRG